MEWDYFSRRAVSRRRADAGPGQSTSIVPVLWAPIRGPVPPEVARVSRFMPPPAARAESSLMYRTEGLRGSIHLDTVAYQELVWMLARKILQTATDLRVDPGDPTPPPDLRRSFTGDT